MFNDKEEKVKIEKKNNLESSFNKLGKQNLEVDKINSVFKKSAQYLLKDSKSYFNDEFNNKPPTLNNFVKSKKKH